jgi:hypothetical protein
MQRIIGFIALLNWIYLTVSACGAGELPRGTAGGNGSIDYKKVDLYVQDEGETKDYDARLIFDPLTRSLRVTQENTPEDVYAEIPYDSIRAITYSNSKHPRWKSATALTLAVTILALPLFFMKGKKHWMTVTFEDVPGHPEGVLILKLDKHNYEQIIATAEGQTGIEVERISED